MLIYISIFNLLFYHIFYNITIFYYIYYMLSALEMSVSGFNGCYRNKLILILITESITDDQFGYLLLNKFQLND